MKITVNSACALCPLVKDKTAIVDYDMETGGTTVLYYVGTCLLGHTDVMTYCMIKNTADINYEAVKSIAETLAAALEPIIEALTGVIEQLAEYLGKLVVPVIFAEMSRQACYSAQVREIRRYNIQQRGSVLPHRVQYRQKGYNKHRRRGEVWR